MPTTKRSLLEYSIPQPADPALGPGTSPPLGLLRTAENVSAGIGDGEVNQLRGLLGMVQHPIQTLNALNEIGRRPSQWVPMIGNALQSSARNAMSGPLGFGQVIGENVGPRTSVKIKPVKSGILDTIKPYSTDTHVDYARRRLNAANASGDPSLIAQATAEMEAATLRPPGWALPHKNAKIKKPGKGKDNIVFGDDEWERSNGLGTPRTAEDLQRMLDALNDN